MTPTRAHLWHMATGAAGEAGELLDAVKKFAVYGQELDRSNLIEELGDLEFFMEGIRAEVGITREQCLIANIHKLRTRYKASSFSNEAAKERADKVQVEPEPPPRCGREAEDPEKWLPCHRFAGHPGPCTYSSRLHNGVQNDQ
jgi:NTP pyrophosphatase (non-canonical NTP hydrolase)